MNNRAERCYVNAPSSGWYTCLCLCVSACVSARLRVCARVRVCVHRHHSAPLNSKELWYSNCASISFTLRKSGIYEKTIEREEKVRERERERESRRERKRETKRPQPSPAQPPLRVMCENLMRRVYLCGPEVNDEKF